MGPTGPNGTKRAGSYAMKSLPWSSIVSKPAQSTKGKRNKNSTIIVHQIFEECGLVETDPYWVSLFTKASYGKFPRGFTYNDDFLTYKRGNKVVQIEIPNAAHEAISSCKSFFSKTVGYSSNQDQDQKRKQLEVDLHEKMKAQYSTWNAIKKKKHLQELVIGNYIDTLVKKHQLDHLEKINLSVVIKTGIFLGHIENKDIDFADGKILSISSLNFDSQTRTFNINPKGKTKRPTSDLSTGSNFGSATEEFSEEVRHMSFDKLWYKLVKKSEIEIMINYLPINSNFTITNHPSFKEALSKSNFDFDQSTHTFTDTPNIETSYTFD